MGTLLSEGEVERILTWLAYQRGGFDEDEAATAIGWARLVRREQRRLDGILRGADEQFADVVPEPAPRRRRHLELVR